MKLLDTQLSHLLRMQLQGAVNDQTQLYTTNRLIPVNYPWVAAYIGTNWVHLFPWVKDCELIEGLNLYDYTSANYNNGFKWLRDYALGRTNILAFSSGDDTPLGIYAKFLQNEFKSTAPGLSLDDIGYTWRNRRKSYARWGDFPKPFVTPTNAVALDSLSSSSITNVYTGLTNIFDTITVEASSVENSAKKVTTGEVRLADVHNRRLLVRHEKTGANAHNLILSLASFRTNATGPTNFTVNDALLNSQQVSTALNSTDTNINIRVTYRRHRALPQTVVTNRPYHWDAFLGMTVQLVVTEDRQIKKGDLAAICFDYGKVSQAMLNVHATELWNMERLLKSNPSATNTLSPDLYQGGAANLMGMAYHERCGRFRDLNERLHKNRVISEFSHGIFSLGAKRVSGQLPNQGDIVLVQPKVDMSFRETAIVGNHTLHPDSGADTDQSSLSYRALDIAEISAEEHYAINSFFRQTDSISTIKLLQLAQQRAASGGSNVLVLNSQNYVAAGNVSYSGIQLKNHDTVLWGKVTDFLNKTSVSNLNVALVTPGAVTNASNSYKGMGALLFGTYFAADAVIGGNLNGGVGPILGDASFTAGNTLNYSLSLDPYGNYSLGLTAPTVANPFLAPDLFADYNSGSVANNATLNNYAYSGFQTAWTGDLMDMLGLGSQGSQNLNFAQSIQAEQGNQGYLGWLSDALSQAGSHVADPVHAVTGEFYINATDLALPGPMPLVVNRNYSSLNLADNQFGFGWKLDYMPYLSINSAATLIYAAEPDGAVLAYEKTATNANVYLPTTASNPQLNNNSTAGIGSVANRLRNRIDKQVGADTFYYLTNPDGSKRTFKVMTFTGSVNQTRPYLTRWEDSRGNFFSFEYGADSSQPDYGQARRVQSSNGNYLGFRFDVYGHIIEVYTGDGRRQHYDFDQFGDLVKVTFPDASEMQYEYEHKTQAVNGQQTPYSTHLILQEIKPDGRLLKNEYDTQRRVTNQWATVGADLTLVRNATFIYSNNFNLTNSFTNTITGFTIIKDVNNNTNRYDYTNGLITKITDTLNQTVIQDWYEASETNKAGYYPRSLESRTDKRGLVTQFKYDSNGNVTNMVTTGDLTGDGTTQSATNTVVYDVNSLPTLTTDPAGNKVQTLYHPQFPFLPEYIIRLAGSTPISTNKLVYGNITNTFVSGGVTYTNTAFGLVQQEIRAFGAPDSATSEWTRDGRGFVTQSVRYTGTTDPAVTNTFFYSDRGEVMEQADGAGRKTTFDYDGLSRPIAREVFEAGQATPLAWEYSYYNPNGELTWSDGPRYDPEDYVWRDYDGAGRLITEIHWRSQARADGVGVEAPTGDALFATTFRQYDGFGNLTRAVDPRGGITTNVWDKLGRLVQRKALDFNGSSVLSSEGFAYEAGGLLRYYTNALNGLAENQYTATGQPKFRRNADGSTNGWRYYLDGRIRREIQGNGAYWETTNDDANRKTIRVFYSAGGTPLATNSTVMDRRGNVVQRIDAGFNVFTNLFDGLDRLKVAAGPAVATVSFDPGTGQYTTNVLQQTGTNFFDAAGVMLTSINRLGDKTITTFDALGRVTRQEIRNAANQIVRETDTAYTLDHHGRLVTQGSGSSALDTYQFTDNDGRDVLTTVFSSGNRMEYALRYYDMGGLLQNEDHLTSDNGSFVSDWARNFTHDALGRLVVQVDRDDAYTVLYPDAMGNVTNRVMPGGLQWQATYNNAGQVTKDWDLGSGNAGTRTNSYGYYGANSPFAGLLQTRSDSRGVTCTCSYDDWLRPATNTQSGSLAEQNLTTAWQYEARGLATNISEQFASSATGPATAVQHRFDAYGQLSSETVLMGGSTFSSAGQSFDAAGRRTMLGLGNGYNFTWQSDGLLASVSLNQFGAATYGYSTAGLITSRTAGARATTVASRDGVGRPLNITTKIYTATNLTETLTWTGDGLLATHTLNRAGDFTDSRAYFYGDLNRRLTEERLNLDSTKRWTNIYSFDNGAGGGPGVLTKVGQTASSSTWTGVKDAFSRIGTETNTFSRQTAYGKVNGLANVSLTLDNVPLSFAIVGTTNQQWPYQWRATMELTAGAHRVDAKAVHTSGMFTTNATSWFTNNIGSITVTNVQDGNGNLTQRIWRKPNGTTNLVQTLAWDGRGRLYKVTERDSTQSGRDFTVAYDALGRRLRTTEIAVTNNIALTNSPLMTDHYFDPAIEFLELGVNEGGKATWKLMGPDFDGRYGGQNGTGGFEAVASGSSFSPVLSDGFGNVLATLNGVSLSWSSNRVSAYGGVPGYRAPAIGGGNVGAEYSWRDRAAESIGFVWTGGNWLDPVSGRFIAFDPLGHTASDNGYSFCGGNPVGYNWDADGRLGKGWMNGWQENQSSPANSSWAYDLGSAIGNLQSGYYEGLSGGASITANTLSFGGSDASGLTESGQYQGSAYTGSRILSTVGRESAIAAATLGTFQLARAGSEGAYYGYQGAMAFNTARSGYAVGTGIDQVSEGNNWGYLQIAGGGLGLAGGFTASALTPELNALFPAQVQLNRLSGLAAEAQAIPDLASEGALVGSRVGAQTSDGLRVIDHLVETPSGQLVAFEIKSGGAVRNAQQLLRDNLMATEGATLVGRNAPRAFRGQQLVIPTVERRYP